MFDKTPKTLDSASESKALKRFEWMISFLICRFHFVHRVLGIMKKIPSKSTSTMGVLVTSDGKLELYFNPAWVDGLTDAELTFVLYHEILHVVLHHCTCRMAGTRDPLWNVAIDLAVNELIEEIPDVCLCPRDKNGKLVGLFVSEFKKDKEFADIMEKQAAEWYYDYLRRKNVSIDSSCFMDDHSQHGQNEITEERIRSLIKEIEKTSMWGSMPQTVKEIILAAQMRRINWRNIIRSWFGNIAGKDRTATRKRPNRRTMYLHPGVRKSYVDKWLVAVDTSGSITSDLLADWLAVLNQLAEDYPIDLMQFDCEKTEGPLPYTQRRTRFEFKGRGGTDFEPVMDVIRKMRYKAAMILTDGCAKAPSKPNAHILWVLPKGCKPPVEWGERVNLERSI